MRGKTSEDRDLISLLDPVVEAAGFELVRLRLMSGTQTRRLQVMAERPDGSMNVEAVFEWIGDSSKASCGANQSKFWQINFNGASRRTFADNDVELKIFHR